MPSKDKTTYGPVPKKRAKRLLEALLAYVNWELEDVAGISLSHKWQDETTKQPKLVIKTQLRTLEFLTAKDKHEGQLTKNQIRHALNEHLKDFLQILEDNRVETQGKEDWHFTLKLWCKDKEKNLEQFESEWERKRPGKSKQQEETLRETVVETFQAISLPKDEGINWQEICQQNLAQQKQLTTNPFTNAYGVTPQLDEIYVPLAIVERKPPKPPSKNQPEEKEEELIPIAEECFFEDVLRQGKSQISQGRKIAIIGELGSGKTTRLQKIADWILEQDLGLPILIYLADLTQPTVSQYIEEIWLKQTGKSFTIEELTQQKERIWLLLDGLDEITSRVETRHVSILLGGWVQTARVVVTCRVNVWEADKNAFSGFDVFRNLGFKPEQATSYIRRWFVGVEDATAGENLEEALAQSENSRLKDLIQNPLRLWMLCQIWHTRRGLPETQTELYRQFVDWVYRWKADEEILDQREAIDEALAQLALVAMEQKDEVSRLRLRESWVFQAFRSRPIFQKVMKLGLLNRVDRFPDAICAFYHATFQEYFAALAVDDWDYFLPQNHTNFPLKGKEYRIFEPQWKQVILFWFGREDVKKEKKEAFLEKLVSLNDGCGIWNYQEVDKGFYEYRSYFMAGAIVAEFKNSYLADAIVNRIIKWRWSEFFNLIQERAEAVLLETDKKRAINGFILLLDANFDEYNRRKIINSWGKIAVGNEQAINRLILLLDETYNEYVRKDIAYILGNISVGHEKKVINRLILYIAEISDEHTRQILVEILSNIVVANEQLVSHLIELIDGSFNEYIRRVIVDILGKTSVGNDKAIHRLILLLDETYNESTRRRIANSLYKIGVGNEQAINRLIQLLYETFDDYTRWIVAYRLGNIAGKNKEIINRLILLIQTFDKPKHRIVTNNLREIAVENKDSINCLIQLLDETSFEPTRWGVANILGNIAGGNEQAINRLIQLLDETSSESTLTEVINSLSKIAVDNEQTISRLIQMLDETLSESTRRAVVDMLGQIALKNEPGINRLIQLFDGTSSEFTRRSVAEILGKIAVDNEQAINRLIQLLDETLSESVCRSVADSLCKIVVKNGQVINSLIILLDKAANEYIRRSVAEILGNIGLKDKQVINRLIQLLDETHNEYTCRKTVDSLGKIATGNEQAINRLIQLFDETFDEYTCRSVADSLGKIAVGNEQAINRLLLLFNETSSESSCWKLADNLGKIIETKQQYYQVLSALKQNFTDGIYKNKPYLYKESYKLIWQCAANLSYSQFYTAWHNS